MNNPVRSLARILRPYIPKKPFENYAFVVGAQKAGTTSLHAYLVNHPMITGGDKKELNFFSHELSYAQGIKHYRNMFPAFTHATHALDASPSYFHRRKVPERIHAFRPDAKIVVILRDPAERAFSAFNHYSQIVRNPKFGKKLRHANPDSYAFFSPLVRGEIEPELSYFLDREFAIMKDGGAAEEPALIRRGIYAPQLERYFRLFGRENVLVLFSDDLKREPEKITNEVFRFIGLEPLEAIEYPIWHARNYTADPAGLEIIRQYAEPLFEKDRQELLEHYDIKVPW